jgi:outer membrane protein OmpA-like peptidoglycan-associated protein
VKLTQLQTDPNLASRAASAIKDADGAVHAAEQPEANKEVAAHRVYLADRKVDTAKALAETRFAEDERAALTAQRDSSRLDARTREADVAKDQALTARAEGAQQKVAADQARSDADAARLATASSEQQAAELQRQLDVLHAKPTEHGLVLTLGDVLFTSGKADLKPGATGNLNKLVSFLNKYPDRSVAIQGYTDSVGAEDYNQGLSERRANSVKSYLAGQGIGSIRLSSSGKGQSDPVAGNDSAAGRQQNRRVEVTISDPPAALR